MSYFSPLSPGTSMKFCHSRIRSWICIHSQRTISSWSLACNMSRWYKHTNQCADCSLQPFSTFTTLNPLQICGVIQQFLDWIYFSTTVLNLAITCIPFEALLRTLSHQMHYPSNHLLQYVLQFCCCFLSLPFSRYAKSANGTTQTST